MDAALQLLIGQVLTAQNEVREEFTRFRREILDELRGLSDTVEAQTERIGRGEQAMAKIQHTSSPSWAVELIRQKWFPYVAVVFAGLMGGQTIATIFAGLIAIVKPH